METGNSGKGKILYGPSQLMNGSQKGWIKRIIAQVHIQMQKEIQLSEDYNGRDFCYFTHPK